MDIGGRSHGLGHEEIIKFQKDFHQFAKRAFLSSWGIFYSLVLKDCNASCSVDFSDATIAYSSEAVQEESKSSDFPVFMWFTNIFDYITKELYLIDSPETLKAKQTVYKLFDAITNMPRRHFKCMEQLKDDNLTEEKIKCILASHYFKPLSNDAECFVDGSQGYKKCLCNVIINADQNKTSFGHPSVWHGCSDILIDKSVVKVGIAGDAPAEYSLDEDDGEPDHSKCSKTEDASKRNELLSQAIAQTIVNAFVESNKEKSLFDKFIPSFLATEKNVRIILYNCKLDKLLVSDELAIWDKNGSLNIETMIFTWVALNRYVNELDDNAKHLLERTPDSRFKDLVGEAYEFYLNGVTRPMPPVTKEHKKEFTLNEKSEECVKVDEHYYILKYGMKLFEASCKEVTMKPDKV